MCADAMIDMHFRIVGTQLAMDHAYDLYAALSASIGRESEPNWLHDSESIGLMPVRGLYVGDGRLQLSRTARFGLRLPVELIPRALSIAGKRLDVGRHSLRVGTAEISPLIPSASVHAHIVTTKNGLDETRFDTEINRQLGELDIKARPVRGRRRFLTIKGKKIIGYELLVSGLTADESIRLQEQGVGGRRKMGCGVFERSTEKKENA